MTIRAFDKIETSKIKRYIQEIIFEEISKPLIPTIYNHSIKSNIFYCNMPYAGNLIFLALIIY
jgi:hypothetical protein